MHHYIKLLLETMEEKDRLRDLDVDRTIVLNILNK